jgi:3-oxoacyl-[acyl-carrier protein] reductase
MSERKKAIVTGASKGIGRAIAEELARHGSDILINYQGDSEAAAAAVSAVTALGADSFSVRADMGEEGSGTILVERALARWGRLDICVNNAAVINDDTCIADIDESVWRRIVNVNINGAFELSQAAVRVMRRQRKGVLVNISSNVTRRLPKGLGPYSASKAALEAMTRIMAKEEGPNGIRVNGIAPGPVNTNMLRKLLENMGQEAAESFKQSLPLQRFGEPAEIARMVAMLASDVASFVTGEIIYVNGGGPGG